MSTLVFRLGDRGPAVAEIRARLARLGLVGGSSHVRDDDSLRPLMRADESQFDTSDPAEWDTTALVSAEYDADVEQAVRRFQQERGITVDGVVGPETFARLEEARWRLGDRVLSYQPSHPFIGEDVLALQRHLNRMGFDCGKEDNHFGPLTNQGLRDFQRNVGIAVDGIAGPDTLRALGRLYRTVGNHSAHQARERYSLPQLQTGVAGKKVVLDPGHGGTDLGDAVGEMDEAAVMASVAHLVQGRLAALGTEVMMTRGLGSKGEPPTERQRADFCNNTDADLVLSLHFDHSEDATTPVGVYFYGSSDREFSAAGKLAAETLAELLDEIPGLATRHGGRTWDMLRMTRMPTVRVSFSTWDQIETRHQLSDLKYQAAIAAAIANGIAAFFAPVPESERAL